MIFLVKTFLSCHLLYLKFYNRSGTKREFKMPRNCERLRLVLVLSTNGDSQDKYGLSLTV